MSYEVNVLVVNEDDCCYFVNEFNTQYKKSVLIAYKLGNTPHMGNARNHYDSIPRIDAPQILAIVNCLMEKIGKNNKKSRRSNQEHQIAYVNHSSSNFLYTKIKLVHLILYVLESKHFKFY